MRRLVLGCFVAAVACAPAVSYAQLSGVVSVSAGPTFQVAAYGPADSTDFAGPAVEVLASGAFDFTPNLGMQGDLRYEFARFEDDGTGTLGREFEASIFDAALHLYFREKDQFLVGAFAQKGATSRIGLDYPDSSYVEDRLYLGGEAQVYLGNLTLYGQAGRVDYTRDYTAYVVDAWFATLEARYFLTPDLRVDGHVGFETGDLYDSLDPDPSITPQTSWNLGVGAEYRPEDIPFSVFAKYDYFEFTWDGSEYTRDRHRLLLGVKFQLDDGTLLDRDRDGPTLKPIEHTSVVPITSGS